MGAIILAAVINCDGMDFGAHPPAKPAFKPTAKKESPRSETPKSKPYKSSESDFSACHIATGLAVFTAIQNSAIQY